MNSPTKKRISDRVNDRIIAGVLGLTGLPEPNDIAVAHAASDAFLEGPRSPSNFNCLVREIVNGAMRASRFTHLPPREAARATILGVLRGAQSAGVSVPEAASLACERVLWSHAALGEDLADCASGIVEGTQQGAKQLNGHAQRVLELVCDSALHAVDDIDPEQLEPTRAAIAQLE